MRKAIVFVLYVSVALQVTGVTYLQAMKSSYKNIIYDSAEAKHYLEKAISVSLDKIDNIMDFKKAYVQATGNGDLILYYQNQYFRSELYVLARAKNMQAEEIRPLLNQINERIATFVEQNAIKIEEFEKIHEYDFGSTENAMKKLVRHRELNDWLHSAQKVDLRK